ncbi:hypothetical protein H2200_010221 [Cladophialophora chaetospira]|uniref:Uncharacterized protein n=1 Tax=Cladophialophora chaetospira TaxID=386627 RepID=A0AA38X2E0_9EURO|nr:hypothetical protein H2200_010221 [Cladophialophora chaetospira]
MDTTATSQPTIDPGRATRQIYFFDLAPEVRNLIYHYLFDRKIVIRETDFKVVHYDGELVRIPIFRRDRSLGSNILFVSKRFHAEAKPILMSVATFDLDPWALRSYGFQSVVCASNMKLIRSLVLRAYPYPMLESAVAVMTSLTNVVVELDERRFKFLFRTRPLAKMMATITPQSLRSLPGVFRLRDKWQWYLKRAFNQFWEHTTRRREKETLAFTVKLRLRYAYEEDVHDIRYASNVCFELVSETAWVEEDDDTASPKIDVKGLVALLDLKTQDWA